MQKTERAALIGVLVALVALIGTAAVVPDATALPAWDAMRENGTSVSSTSALSETAHAGLVPSEAAAFV
ncbi:MAG TPA: hypothetical protein PK324_18990, partial [Nocardioides sp.]|nr:hypothetical protein [Nocardioides sp.]